MLIHLGHNRPPFLSCYLRWCPVGMSCFSGMTLSPPITADAQYWAKARSGVVSLLEDWPLWTRFSWYLGMILSSSAAKLIRAGLLAFEFLQANRKSHSTKQWASPRLLNSASVSAKLLQSCLTLCDCMDSSPPGSSVHGILLVRILEWVAMPSSRGSSCPQDRTWVFMSPALVGGFFTTNSIWEAPIPFYLSRIQWTDLFSTSCLYVTCLRRKFLRPTSEEGQWLRVC